MPRSKQNRKIDNPPAFKGFRPIGRKEEGPPVIMNYEEYEAIRLCDHKLLSQAEAAIFMEISRPTFTRIYESARRKVALAFAEARTLIFEGGKVFFDSSWYHCQHCDCWFNQPDKTMLITACALCGHNQFIQSHP